MVSWSPAIACSGLAGGGGGDARIGGSDELECGDPPAMTVRSALLGRYAAWVLSGDVAGRANGVKCADELANAACNSC